MEKFHRNLVRKVILVVFSTTIFSTPCLAQIQPDSLFSLHETLWVALDRPDFFGFADGKAYYSQGWGWGEVGEYQDTPVISTFVMSLDNGVCIPDVHGWLNPFFGVGLAYIPYNMCYRNGILIMIKIQDDWINYR